MNGDLSELLTTDDVARLLKIDLRTLYRMIKDGQIPVIKVGGLWRFQREELLRWLKSKEKKTGVTREKSILVVDDEKGVRDYIVQILSMKGNLYNITAVGDGQAALNEFRSKHFDLMILDLKIPGMDGMDILKRAKELQPDLKTIIVTGYPSMESAINAVNLGVSGYLQKPFQGDELIAKSQEILE